MAVHIKKLDLVDVLIGQIVIGSMILQCMVKVAAYWIEVWVTLALMMIVKVNAIVEKAVLFTPMQQGLSGVTFGKGLLVRMNLGVIIPSKKKAVRTKVNNM